MEANHLRMPDSCFMRRDISRASPPKRFSSKKSLLRRFSGSRRSRNPFLEAFSSPFLGLPLISSDFYRAPYKIHFARLKHGFFHPSKGNNHHVQGNVQVFFMHPDPCFSNRPPLLNPAAGPAAASLAASAPAPAQAGQSGLFSTRRRSPWQQDVLGGKNLKLQRSLEFKGSTSS